MARRKEDKLRPYRVDYFLVDEMKDYDKALIHSTVVRAVTSDGAASQMGGGTNVVIIRAYRYYKKLGTRKQDVYKAVEDLFSPNKAVKVMEQVEARRAVNKGFDRSSSIFPYEGIRNATNIPEDQKNRLLGEDENGHQTRFSDSSLYDEVCNLCGATDRSVAGGGTMLDRPCPNAAPKSGPDSPATKQVMTDYTGMFAHDAHEKTMDTFVPTPGEDFPPSKTEIIMNHIDLDAAAPVLHPAPESGDEIARALAGTAEIVSQRAINDPMPGTPIFPPPDRIVGGEPLPLYMKLLIYGTFSALAIIIVLAILHGGK